MQTAGDPIEHQPCDLGQLLGRQGAEDDDLVDAVDELRPEAPLQDLHQLVTQLVERLVAPGVLLDALGAEVRGHDHDGVLEVDRASLCVGESAVVHDLQQDVEDVRVGLLDLVEKKDRIRATPHPLRELSRLLVADVARRSADEP